MPADSFDLPTALAQPGEPVIRMRGITKVFSSAAGQVAVLKGIDIDVRQGEFVSVVGRSGSGKSTLVNMLTRIDRPTSGTVQVGSVMIKDLPEGKMAIWRGKNMGVVFQFFQLLPMLTLVENVILPMDFCNVYPPASREKRALELLERVGLEKLAYKLPGAVSGGQQQSAAVARALANDPPILIADEPTGNLDSSTAEQVIGIFEELIAQGKTVLMVTHDQVLAQRTSRILLISDGELVDEAVARAFPRGAHPTLLHLSKLAKRVHLSPGEALPDILDLSNAQILVVSKGDLFQTGSNPKALLGPGSVLDPSTRSVERLRSADQGAELLVLPRADVQPLLIRLIHRPALQGIQARAPPLKSQLTDQGRINNAPALEKGPLRPVQP